MATTPEEFIAAAPEERQEALTKLRNAILDNLPKGFEESCASMIHYVVPFSLYPAGYHCPPKQPLPFMSVANQKGFIALYHMGIYATPELHKWFVDEYPKHSKFKLDMGKSCIRFKRPNDIPFDLIGQLVTRMTPEQWIGIYEDAFKNR
ncbi:MAG: DUF1801 domain-containing protein [Bacteroidetes bacterium]|nr:DUF1801 domain-containing protein [Bacteroidota bacterium]